MMHRITLKSNEGFTLVELMVVILIIGILAAIALPSFVDQHNKNHTTKHHALTLDQKAMRAVRTSCEGNTCTIRVPTYSYTMNNQMWQAAQNLPLAHITTRVCIDGLLAGPPTSADQTLIVVCRIRVAPHYRASS